MTTQGSEEKNYNNHPFLGQAGGRQFALAHNGVLHNDLMLRRSLKLPHTKIETDSYVAVQLIERKKALLHSPCWTSGTTGIWSRGITHCAYTISHGAGYMSMPLRKKFLESPSRKCAYVWKNQSVLR